MRPGRLRCRLSLIVAGLLAMAVHASTGNAASYFQITLTASGVYRADFFDDRLAPGLTTAIGVDGQEARGWHWQVRALGRMTTPGTVQLTRAAYRASTRRESDLVSYSILMGQLGETPLGCTKSEIRRSWDGTGEGPPDRGDFVRFPSRNVALIESGQFVHFFEPFLFGMSFACEYHGDHDVEYLDVVGVAVPGRALALPPGQQLSKTFRSHTSQPADHPPVDRNQLHTFTASSELTVTIRAITQQRWQRLAETLATQPRNHPATEPVLVPSP